MNSISLKGIPQKNFYTKPKDPIDNLVTKAEETIRRTNLQSAAKSPTGAVLAAAKYIATDAIKENIKTPELASAIPGAKYLNSKAAIDSYKKSGI